MKSSQNLNRKPKRVKKEGVVQILVNGKRQIRFSYNSPKNRKEKIESFISLDKHLNYEIIIKPNIYGTN